MCLLVVIGVREDGTKELLAVEDGYRESTESWATVMRDLKARGANEPKLVIGDGALGTWAALRDVFPGARRQACWVHAIARVLDSLPKRLQPTAKKLLHEIMKAASRADARLALERFRDEVHEQDVTVRGCPHPLRQIAVRGLGHDHPTLILTNDRTSTPKKIVGRYAKRMRIEQRLAESIRSFHLDALSSAVALNVDLDTTLTVWAAATYDALRRQLPGYERATPDTIWRRFISTSGQITIGPDHVTCRLNSRTYSPVMRTASLPKTQIPWWNGRHLRLEFA